MKPGYMTKARALLAVCILSSVFCFAASDTNAADKAPSPQRANPPMQFSRNPDISQIKPRKPVKIKLHRSGKGEYQWEISGDNADDIVRADKRLRKLLELE